MEALLLFCSNMSKKLKATELFLSLGLAATLVTGCGAPDEGGEAIEGDTDVEEVEPGAVEPGAVEPETVEPEAEGGEGGEGGEG